MRQKFLSLLLVFVLAVSCVAQQPSAKESAPDVERLRAHVSYLASDKLEGRRTGSAGATLAAEYVAREFARAGLRRSVGRDLPGMSILEADSPRRYMQEFPFVAGVELGKNNKLRMTLGAQPDTLDLRAGEDWLPLGFSSNASLSDLPIAFVNYGIKADELNYDDYANAPVKGRIAVALSGSPDGDNPHGQFARYEDVRWKAIAARNAGAAALFVISAEENFKDERLARLSYDQSVGEAGLPVVVVSRQVALRLFQLSSVGQLTEFETKLGEFLKTRRADTPDAQGKMKLTITPRPDLTFSLSTDLVRRNAPAYNVVGILDGSDPALKGEAIVIGAHYDHLGRGGQGSLAQREGDVHHGADDNASGVAGMLELARTFSSARTRRTLVFVAFGGEEEGLLGSSYYVNHPVWPLDKTVAMLNMDMIGRMKEQRLMIGGVGTATEWKDLIKQVQDSMVSRETASVHEGKKVYSSILFTVPFALTLNEDGYGPSDHSSFYTKRVPVLFFFTGTHDDYHKPSDTAEKIAYEDEAKLLSFIAGIVRSVDARAKPLTFTVARSQSQGRAMGFRVYLGTIPNYAESNDGMKLDGVREDSPAAAAGLKAGDKIIRMAGSEVRNVYDYTAALGEMKAGQEYEVEVVRGSETLKLKITPAARK
ncbi:MAG TPA: M20/M25/M40 family metallo-hydrolase [Pyrinomonadaceae bacterium]|nr:M20/M25/M40 family metallo-hydrolase [Pyrinomonadaceae bacterium]